jgi:hypothetical protein
MQTSGGEHGVPYHRCRPATDAQSTKRKLILANPMQQLDARTRDRRMAAVLQSQHRTQTLFHPAVIVLDDIVEQDHCNIKSRVRPMLGFKQFENAATAIAGVELIHRIRKGQFALGRLRKSATAAPEILGVEDVKPKTLAIAAARKIHAVCGWRDPLAFVLDGIQLFIGVL